jgi:hypothetical protein
MTMKWVTHKDVSADSIASCWLIRRFLDRKANILLVDEDQVLETAARKDAVPFDLPRHPELRFTQHNGLSTFEALVREFNLEDPALIHLARIVHAAENADSEGAPEGPGFRAVAEGFRALSTQDESRLGWGFSVCDALYVWCCQHVI